MFEVLDKLSVITPDIDIILYDVLGDVVCGGFAVPIRKNYAREIYIVTSGEFMSLYAANNICKCIARFSSADKGRLAGIIGNARFNKPWEEKLIDAFAREVGSRMVTFFPRDDIFHKAEISRQTVTAYDGEHDIAVKFADLARVAADSPELVTPTPLEQEGLDALVNRYV